MSTLAGAGPGEPVSRTHGSIRLVTERCTSCMICARECPTWCIHIDSHAEPLTDIAPGARTRTRNVLDRFEVDWALCMYCGICIDQCPFDALEWAGPHVAPATRLVDLVHGADQLERGHAPHGQPSGGQVSYGQVADGSGE